MARYQNQISIQKTATGKSYYSSVIPTDVVEEQFQYQFEARLGDRWDTLAYKYLGSAALWYVIANANNSLNGSIFIKPGTLIIIPQIY
jgi:nucleoid-associated protein YgaU